MLERNSLIEWWLLDSHDILGLCEVVTMACSEHSNGLQTRLVGRILSLNLCRDRVEPFVVEVYDLTATVWTS